MNEKEITHTICFLCFILFMIVYFIGKLYEINVLILSGLIGIIIFLIICGIILIIKEVEIHRTNNMKYRFCFNCNERTSHIKCGFGTIGGLVGNARWECEECRKEWR